MIDKLVQLVIAVVIAALLGLFLSWAMAALGVPPMLQTAVWVLFGLLAVLAVVGVFGYGPFKGPWASEKL